MIQAFWWLSQWTGDGTLVSPEVFAGRGSEVSAGSVHGEGGEAALVSCLRLCPSPRAPEGKAVVMPGARLGIGAHQGLCREAPGPSLGLVGEPP